MICLGAGFDPRFRRRRRLLSWVEQAAGRDVLDLAAVWRDGSILCEVIHRACPAACQGWEESQSRDTFRHAQALVYRCLQLDPVRSHYILCVLTRNIKLLNVIVKLYKTWMWAWRYSCAGAQKSLIPLTRKSRDRNLFQICVCSIIEVGRICCSIFFLGRLTVLDGNKTSTAYSL